MKTLMLNLHSKNNKNVFLLTIKNHSEYAAAHEFDMLNVDTPYHANMNVQRIARLLQDWDRIIMIGSDIVFTNMSINATSLANPNTPLTMGPDPSMLFAVNGDFYIFQRTPRTEELLNKIDQRQKEKPHNFGCQGSLCEMLKQGELTGLLDILPPRILQSFPDHKDILPPVRGGCFWKPGDLCIHFVGGSNWKKCIDILAFMELKIIYNA